MVSPVTIDFETHPIEDRPRFPPEPVGVSIRWTGGERRYFAWGHPVGNNCPGPPVELRQFFELAAAGECPLLFHNAKFDLAVACEGLGLPMPRWDMVHDTQILLFLADPHSRTLELKPAAEALLGWAPEEKDAVGDWVWENRVRLREAYPGSNITRSGGKVNRLYEWFARVPADVLAPYANGDVERTFRLFEFLYPRVLEAGMGRAYDRERQLLPILMENERIGMRVDLDLLAHELPVYERAFAAAEHWLRWRLQDPGLNLDADVDLADALRRRGIVSDEDWTLTKTGQLSVSKKNLRPHMFKDPQVASVLGYRNRLQTAMNMFMIPWLRQASARGGWISTNWNQTRGDAGGTRTGRPSTSNPNFLNISKDFETKKDGYVHPEFLQLPRLPLVRKYILPDEGCRFLHRDFSGQELRVFAHFESGPLHAAYLANPKLDPHDEWVRPIMEGAAGREFDRTTVKVLNFQGIYGGGAQALADALEITLSEAKALKKVHDAALPGRLALAKFLEAKARRDEPIVTLGGRLYFVEPPGFNKKYGRDMDYYYKLINYLIQGSAADLTKQAIIDWYHHPLRTSRFLVTVYDEINVSAAEDDAARQMQILREVMEAPRLSVPMLSDGKWGPAWGKLEKCA